MALGRQDWAGRIVRYLSQGLSALESSDSSKLVAEAIGPAAQGFARSTSAI